MATLAEYIQNLYQTQLGRGADQAGLDYWTNQLSSGAITRDALADQFRNSQEAVDYRLSSRPENVRQFLSNQYQQNLGRTGFDVEGGRGIDFWQNEIDSGRMSAQEVANRIANSDEAIKYAAMRQLPVQEQIETAPSQAGEIGLAGQESALGQGYRSALEGLQAGTQQGRADISQGAQQAIQTMQGGVQAGQGATSLMEALSGAAGADAQRQAYADYNKSPAQQYLQQEAERALMRNSAAMGGLGGGNVRRALQEQAVGLARQDFGDSFNRLGTVAQLNNPFIQNTANLQAGTGQALGNIAVGAGNQAGQYGFNTGQLLSQARGQAGRDIAGITQGIGQNMANLSQQQGAGIADIYGSGGASLAGILTGAGTARANLNQSLLQQLINSGMMQPAQQQVPGTTQTQGALGQIGNLAQAAATAYSGFGF